jgi:hypothetical protein
MKRGLSVNTICIFLLLSIFTISSLFVAVLGTRVFDNIHRTVESNYETRTSLVYIQEKMKQHHSNEVDIKTIDGVQVLSLREVYSGVEYFTYIYLLDQTLMEVTIQGDAPVSLRNGDEIMPLKDLKMEKVGNFYQFEIETMFNIKTQNAVFVRS